jgi:hypothetical protein
VILAAPGDPGVLSGTVQPGPRAGRSSSGGEPTPLVAIPRRRGRARDRDEGRYPVSRVLDEKARTDRIAVGPRAAHDRDADAARVPLTIVNGGGY